MKKTLTPEQIRILAQLERDMDDGKITFVVLRGQRVAVSATCMEELGLRHGQTINDDIFEAILCQHLAEVNTAIAIENAKKG